MNQGLIVTVLIMSATATLPVDPDLMDDDLIFTTPIRAKHRNVSPIRMRGARFVSRQGVHTSYNYYSGYVAKVGDNITIVCNVSKALTNLTLTRFSTNRNATSLVVSEGDRISVDERSDISEVVIHRASAADSGRYNCNNDAKYLTVIEPSNPPRVISHYCISNTFNDLVCTFQTNADRRDLVNWNISFSTREMRTCHSGLCVGIPCTNLLVLPATTGYADDVLQCQINDWVFVNMVYELRVVGENIYASSDEEFTTTLGYKIVKLARPTVLEEKVKSTSAAIHIQLNDNDMSSKKMGVNSFTETAIIENGVKYEVKIDSELLRARNQTTQVPRIVEFVEGDTASWIELEDLLPHTTYSLEIVTQLNNTDNGDIWSAVTSLELTTLESRPDVAPAYTPHAFTVTASAICPNGRLVTLHWQNVAEYPKEGNGVITSYDVYNMFERKLSFHGLNSFSPPQYRRFLSTRVNSSESYAEMCVSDREMEFAVVAVNSAGWGKRSAQYYVPAASDMLVVKPCDITVIYYKFNDMLEMTWHHIPKEYNVTVFWCETDIQYNCLNQAMRWREMGDAQNFQLYDWKKGLQSLTGGTSGYKFGLSAHVDTRISSGIVWAPCINHWEEELRPATADVRLLGLEATVMVKDECQLNSRMSEYYTVKACRYDTEVNECLEQQDSEEVLELTLDRCVTSATLVLHKHSTDYAFWILSHAAAMTANSSVIVKRTDRKALTWEIPVSVILSLLAVVGITLCLVYFRKQKKKVKRLKKPQLVLPTTLMIEVEDHSAAESDDDNQSLLVPFSNTSQSYSPMVVKPIESESVTRFTDYENKKCMGDDSSSDIKDHYPSKYDRAKLQPTLSYQPAMAGFSDSMDYKNTSNITSCGRLPDDYLQCTKAEPGLNELSAQLFFADDSNNTFIDLNKFLVDAPSATRTMSEYSNRVDMARVEEDSVDVHEDGCSKSFDTAEAHKPDTVSTENVPNVFEQDNNSECRLTDYIVNTPLVPSQESHEIRPTSSRDIPENSSGDSGYVGRNLGTEMCPRSNSMSSTES